MHDTRNVPSIVSCCLVCCSSKLTIIFCTTFTKIFISRVFTIFPNKTLVSPFAYAFLSLHTSEEEEKNVFKKNLECESWNKPLVFENFKEMFINFDQICCWNGFERWRIKGLHSIRRSFWRHHWLSSHGFSEKALSFSHSLFWCWRVSYIVLFVFPNLLKCYVFV